MQDEDDAEFRMQIFVPTTRDADNAALWISGGGRHSFSAEFFFD